MGRAPDFIDGHQHVHQLPQIRTALLQEMKQRYPVEGPWLRGTRAPAQSGVPWQYRFKAKIIQTLGAAALKKQAGKGYRVSPRLLGVYDFQGGEPAYAQWLAVWLALMRDGDVLMCHPASHIITEDTLGAQRVAEFNVLSAPETGYRLANLALVL